MKKRRLKTILRCTRDIVVAPLSKAIVTDIPSLFLLLPNFRIFQAT